MYGLQGAQGHIIQLGANEALYDVARKTYLQISSRAPGVQLD